MLCFLDKTLTLLYLYRFLSYSVQGLNWSSSDDQRNVKSNHFYWGKHLFSERIMKAHTYLESGCLKSFIVVCNVSDVHI